MEGGGFRVTTPPVVLFKLNFREHNRVTLTWGSVLEYGRKSNTVDGPLILFSYLGYTFSPVNPKAQHSLGGEGAGGKEGEVKKEEEKKEEKKEENKHRERKVRGK